MRKMLVPLLAAIAFAGMIPVADTQAPKIPDPPLIKVFDASQYGRGYVPPTPEKRAALYAGAKSRHGERLAMQGKFQSLPAAFDCREKGWVPPVGDQGQCGSCYLYSTIYGTLSSSFIRAGYGKADGSFLMSVQYGMDCHNFGGCNGGNGTEVIDWALKNGWPAAKWTDLNGVLFLDYPSYSARSLTCRKVANAKYWRPMDWGFATGDQSNRPATVDEIKTALFNYGPLNVALDAGGQFGNGTSTITSLGNNIDHEIEITGYNDADKTLTLKNQWSEAWGNGGYRKLAYSAAPRLVDIFWTTAASLPPPPPSPTVIMVAVPNVTGGVGTPVKIVATASGGTAPYTILYAYGDGSPQDTTGSHAYQAGGSFTITATAVDAKSQSGSGTATAMISTGPPPPIPGGAGTITWTINGVTQSFELVPIGTRDAIKKVQDLIGPITP